MTAGRGGWQFRLESGRRELKIDFMSAITDQPIPKNLRQQMVERISTAPEEDVVFVHDMLLIAEKERLWKKIQNDAEAEQAAGKLDNIPELVRQYRNRNKAA